MSDSIKKKLKLKVSAISEGTVIDHIPSENLFKVISILELDKVKEMITFGANLDSVITSYSIHYTKLYDITSSYQHQFIRSKC